MTRLRRCYAPHCRFHKKSGKKNKKIPKHGHVSHKTQFSRGTPGKKISKNVATFLRGVSCFSALDHFINREHTGDNRTGLGDGDDEVIKVSLDKIPAEISKIVIAVTIHEAEQRRQNFGQVHNAAIRLVNLDTNVEVTRYDLSEDASVETAMIFGEIYRYNDEWKFRAVGQGYSGGLRALAIQHGINI